MKIKYEHDGVSLLTKCPHGMNPKVGSSGCNLCDHFGDWLGRNTILCNYKEEEVNIEELKKEVEELKAKVAEFEKQEKIDWVPEMGQKFYFFTTYGTISASDSWANGADEFGKLYFHNVYPDFDSIEAALPDITRCNAIIRACRLVEPWFVPDWEGNRNKHTSDVVV